MLGFIMLWAFFDKLLGLGFATTPDKAWIQGVSPTAGFLKSATHGPFVSFYQSLSGNTIIDLLFMSGLLLIGLALILGIGVKIAGYSGAIMMFLMWLSLLPPKNNPLLDEHSVYLVLFIGLTLVNSGDWLGFGGWWSKTSLVKQFPILR